MLRKVGRYFAGRVQGSKGVKKYDTWMEKNPGFRKALGVGDLALAFYGPGLVGKGLQAAGKGLGAASGLGRAATTAGNFLAGAPAVMGGEGANAFQVLPKGPGLYERAAKAVPGAARAIGRGAQAVGRAALANPEVTGAVLTSLPAMSQQAAQAEQQRQMNALLMQQTAEQQRRRQEMMDLLRPLFVRLQQGR